MAPSHTGDINVSDGYRNARLHRFSGDGRFISSWGEPGKEGPKQFHLPHRVLVDKEGTVFVCDRENNRIRVFSADWRFRERWSDKTGLPCQGLLPPYQSFLSCVSCISLFELDT